ncbi:MAG TPA: dTDP-4-dehydrorhamnose 3,5-epimerase [Nitrospiraceae bacterium]|nr:dTDP-4-dehydrorhamnose 3,5-epimerase [Nitrospiraceae bacterium]
MFFTETKLKGAYIVEMERLEDDRGFFARSWCRREFHKYGLDPNLVQCSVSFNKKRGTLRGMHYQVPPFAESKLVRCTKGAIYDVILDLRQDSSTFLQWLSVELTSQNRRMLYIPKLFAHGFLTLKEDTEVFYQISEFYSPNYARGVRWNDPLFQIQWPEAPSIISPKDQKYQDSSKGQFLTAAGLE